MPQSELQRLSRRRFMQVSAAAGGGLLIGFGLTSPESRGAPSDSRQAAAALNSYVRIDRDGAITLIMPKVEMGQGTYTAIPMLLAEELEVDPAAIRIEPAAAPDPAFVYEINGDQSTGTSSSIRDCWLPVRKAGATARSMLIAAAARAWSVSPADCRAARGTVVHTPSGRKAGYGTLAAAAARLPAPKDAPLKPTGEFKWIGRSLPRRDSASKSNGEAIFGIDVRPAGLKVAMLEQAPAEGGRVVEPLTADAALKIPGVQQIVNEGDMVAVVATDTWAAMQGLKALKCRWTAGPNANVRQVRLIAELEDAAQRKGARAAQAGDVGAALARAASRIEATYHQPFLAHATMEPMNCTVHFRPELCEIWVGTQALDRAVAKLGALGLSPAQIRIHNQLIGGGFGRRLEVDGIVAAARIARHVEGPVKVLWSRAEDIRHDRYRPIYVDRLAAGLDSKGVPIAWRHTIAGSGVTSIWSGEPLKNDVDDDAVESAQNVVYDFKNFEVHYVRQDPQGVPTSWWRGVGPTRSVFVIESFIDELAAAAKQDPIQYRRALIKDPRLKAVLDLAAEKSGWGKSLPPNRGRGVSIQSAFGSHLAQVVEVSMPTATRVRLERVVCAFDCGIAVNPDGVRSQLEGGALFGLSAALMSEVTIENGRVQQSNFHDYPVLRMPEIPPVEVHLIESGASPGGVGETGTACVAAALCNAIYAATGKRLRALPVSRWLKA